LNGGIDCQNRWRASWTDAPLFAAAHLVHGGTHVVVDPTSRHAAEDPEGVTMRVEQHLMRLHWISTNSEGPAVAELAVRNLQLRAGAADDGKILAPVELERFAWPECQRHEGAPAGSPLKLLALLLPGPAEGGHSIVGAVVAKAGQVTVQLLDGATLFAGPVLLPAQPR
jgi:hypothetical protein